MESHKVEALYERVLIVDDEVNIRNVLKTRLTNIGYTVFLAADGQEALNLYRKLDPTLIILDIMLPKLDGFEVCTEIRKESQIPIIMLTALNDISERVMGLELGADDYITKPFFPKELEARVRSILRRRNDQFPSRNIKKSNTLQIGPLTFDFTKRQVFRESLKIKLTSMEFNLLELLVANAGMQLSRALILDNVWGYTPERSADTRVVDVHISRLRSKIEDDPSDPDFILTARGTGYMFPKYNN